MKDIRHPKKIPVPPKHIQKHEEVPKRDRRNLIKLLLVGGGGFVVGKLFGSLTDVFTDKVLNTIQFKNFNFVETEKTMTISDKKGEALLIVDKDSANE